MSLFYFLSNIFIIFSATSQRCSCSDSFKKVSWKIMSEKQSERNNGWDYSEAELGCNFQQDTAGNGKACYKFYISDTNNNRTNNSLTMPCVSEFYSCMQNCLQVNIVKSNRVAVSVHERFFNGKLQQAYKYSAVKWATSKFFFFFCLCVKTSLCNC